MRRNLSGNGRAQVRTKSYAPFPFGMRSVDYKGVGANLSVGTRRDNAYLEKSFGDELFKQSGFSDIHFIGEFVREDGGHQIVTVGDINGDVKFRAYKEEDGTEIIPTSDPTLGPSTNGGYDFVSMSAGNGFLGGSNTYKWDGVDLAVTNGFTPLYLEQDGLRLVYGNASNSRFSGSDIQVSNNLTNGTGVDRFGDYNTSIAAVAAQSLSTGVLFMGQNGAEVHWVQESRAIEDVSSQTKVPSFFYRGLGVRRNNHLTVAKNFAYFINEEGMQEMNTSSGETINLFDFGKIARYFSEWSLTNSVIAYNSREDLICLQVSTGTANDLMVCVDLKTRERDVFIRRVQPYTSLAQVGNEFYGSFGGQIHRLFSGFETRDNTATEFDYIIEWDGLESTMEQKFLKKIVVMASLDPLSEMEISAYFDGELDPFYSETFNVDDSGNDRNTTASWGSYTLGGGNFVDNPELSDRIQERRRTKRFQTIAIRVKEVSGFPFRLHDIRLYYKNRGKVHTAFSMQNTLF